MDNVLLAAHFHISEDDAGQVGREIAVAAERRGERIGKERNARDEDNVETVYLKGTLFKMR